MEDLHLADFVELPLKPKHNFNTGYEMWHLVQAWEMT